MMSEGTFRVITTILGGCGGLVAMATLIKSVIEYSRQGRQKKVEFYFQLEKSLLDNCIFKQIRAYLRSEDPDDYNKLRNIPKIDRSDFAGFFENIAMLVKGGHLPKMIACYMFSYDAVLCWKCQDFWHDFVKDDPYWCVLREFVEDMMKIRQSIVLRRSDLHF